MIKTTYEKLFYYNEIAQAWLEDNPPRERTKLGYAISRLTPRVRKAFQQYQNLREDIAVDTCAVDEKGLILRETHNNEYKYTKEKQAERNQRWRKLYESEIEIEPYFATQAPNDLTVIEREAFAGLVIREEDAFPEDKATAAEA